MIPRTVPSTWGPALQEGVAAKDLSVVPFDVELDYDYWGYREFVCRPETPDH